MTQHDPWVRIRHMLKHAREAVALARSRHRSDFDGDRVLQLAMTRLVEIVGEAASKVAPEVRQRYSSVPWNQIVGMRQRSACANDLCMDTTRLTWMSFGTQ